MLRALFVTTMVTTFFATACSAQKGSDYAGKPAAQVRGTIVTQGTPPPNDAIVQLVWNNFAKSGDTLESANVPARGDFPANFTIDIFSPPSSDQLNDFSRKGMLPNESRVGVATIYAVAPGITKVDGKTPILGVVEDFVVVYLEQDAIPGTIAATFVGGPLSAGFHLMKVSPPALPSGENGKAQTACYRSLPPGLNPQETYAKCHAADVFDKLHEAEQGFATEITLKLAPEKDLNVPNYN